MVLELQGAFNLRLLQGRTRNRRASHVKYLNQILSPIFSKTRGTKSLIQRYVLSKNRTHVLIHFTNSKVHTAMDQAYWLLNHHKMRIFYRHFVRMHKCVSHLHQKYYDYSQLQRLCDPPKYVTNPTSKPSNPFSSFIQIFPCVTTILKLLILLMVLKMLIHQLQYMLSLNLNIHRL